jgi:phage tail-like protein
MAISKDTIKNTYPLPVYNYMVSIGGTNMSFSEVSGLSVQYEPISYKHGLSWKEGEEIMPGMKQSLRITLKKGLIKKGHVLHDWIGTVKQNKATKHDIIINLCDEAGIPVITWLVIAAVPLKLMAPTFDASSNDVAIESLEVMAADMIVTFH